MDNANAKGLILLIIKLIIAYLAIILLRIVSNAKLIIIVINALIIKYLIQLIINVNAQRVYYYK